MHVHIRKDQNVLEESRVGLVVQSGLDDGTLDTAFQEDVTEEIIDSVKILTVKSNGRKYHQPLDSGVIHNGMISWRCDSIVDNNEMADTMLEEYSKGLVLYRHGHPTYVEEWWVRLSDGFDVSIDYSVDEFDPLIVPSIRKLVTEYLLGDSDSIYMDGPDSVLFIKDGIVNVQTDIDFGTAEVYHYVIDKFILQPSTISNSINNMNSIPYLDGYLTLGDGFDKVSLARINAIYKPHSNLAKVNITKRSLENEHPDSYAEVLTTIRRLLSTLEEK